MLAAAVVLTTIVASAVVWTLKPAPLPEPAQVVRFDHELSEGQVFRDLNRPAIAVSPDGRQVVYNTSAGLYLLSVNEFDARLIPGTEGRTSNLTFSPDGQWLAYYSLSDGTLQKISVNGGAPVVLTEVAGSPYGVSWAANDTIVYSTPTMMQISGNGGAPEPVSNAAGTVPQLLPGSDSVLFVDGGEIFVQSLDGTAPQLLFPGTAPHYVPTGHIIYVVDGSLYAQVFDLSTLSAVGGPVPVVEDVMSVRNNPQYAVSDSGTLAYMPGTGGVESRFLVWVDRDGSEEPLAAEPRGYTYPRISPDGRRAALVEASGILVWDFQLETLTRLTVDPLGDNYPVWTPDGERIAYRHDEDVYWKASNNTGSAELLVENPGEGDASPYFFSPDGKTLVFREQPGRGRGALENLGMISPEDDAEPVWLLRSEFTERNAVLSPNGLFIAYQSNESGRFEVFVSPFPNFEDDRVQISNSGGEDPLWSPDGRELFYLEPGSPVRLMVMSVETEPDFTPGDRRPLLNWPYDVGGDGRMFDIAPDGDRFLAISLIPIEEDVADTTVPKVNIVLNWFEELKERVPVP